MTRVIFCSFAAVALFAVVLARADDSNKQRDNDQNQNKATITKVDSKKSTMTVTMKDEDGKEVEKTFQLTDGAEYLDSHGKAAKLNAFQPGDHVLIAERDGKLTELKKCVQHSHATITKVDSKKGTVAVTMKDHYGKEVDKTFQLAKGVEYLDGHGKAARLDAFQPKDHVLITEKDGEIAELKKCKEQAEATITKVDAEKGTITVTMKAENGKKTEKVFDLIEEAEYVDSTGEVAMIDVFQSGDAVLIIESNGRLAELKQDSKQKTPGVKVKTATGKKSAAK
jgi:uncharacterized protein YigE (DUF2233 family)